MGKGALPLSLFLSKQNEKIHLPHPNLVDGSFGTDGRFPIVIFFSKHDEQPLPEPLC